MLRTVTYIFIVYVPHTVTHKTDIYTSVAAFRATTNIFYQELYTRT